LTQATPLQGVLFDLDGTLLDTSQDMAAALNALLREEGRTELPYEKIRAQVSHGARGLLQLGFGLSPVDEDFLRLRDRFLELYEADLYRHTRLFAGMDEVLEWCEARGLRWGIVTNKPGYLTQAVIRHLELWQRTACVVSGDCLPRRKPHPDPLLLGAEQAGLTPENCCYVGDAERDIQAGKNARMRTVCALWGFIGEDEDPLAWQADINVQTPAELHRVLEHWAHD
jgi:phosphoglycolate phosphatase